MYVTMAYINNGDQWQLNGPYKLCDINIYY